MRLMTSGAHPYQLRCIDKLGHTFRGDESLLDVGCGDGSVARLLRDRVREVVAIDIQGFDKWDAATPGLTFQVPNGEDLPFHDASFDRVPSKDSLHHMDRPELALLEYRRVLRPGGAALIVEANRFNPSFFLQMTLLRGHQHFRRSRFEHLVRAVFPETRFGAFEAHYVPGATRLLRLQHAVEERLERLGALRPVLAYNFAVT